VKLVLNEIWWKLTALEMSAQYAQRQSQTLTFGVLGAAGATAGGRLVNALVPGAPASLPAQIAINTGSGLVGTYAAWTQWSAIIIKNIRRDSGGDVSFLSQLWEGMYAPLALRWRGQKAEEAKTVAIKFLKNLPFNPNAPELLEIMNDEGVAELVNQGEFGLFSDMLRGTGGDDPLVGSSRSARRRLPQILERDIADTAPGAFPKPAIEARAEDTALRAPKIDDTP